MNQPSSSAVPKEWKKLWHIEVIPRVKMLLWRACTNPLPTKMNLRRRGSEVDTICVLCGEHEENVDHLFMHCKPVALIWHTSVLRLDMEREPIKHFREWLWDKMHRFPMEYVELLAYIVWEIWNQRNNVIFEGRNFKIQEIIGRWNEAVEGRGRRTTKGAVQQKVLWSKPLPGELKLNCDVAVTGEGKIGMGFVIRDENGAVLLAEECMASGGSTVLERIAMRFACRKAVQFNLKVAVIECDSKILIDSLNSQGVTPVYCEVMIKDIKELAQQLGCREFEFVKREGNKVAHYAAKGPVFLCINHPPSHLSTFLRLDS